MQRFVFGYFGERVKRSSVVVVVVIFLFFVFSCRPRCLATRVQGLACSDAL